MWDEMISFASDVQNASLCGEQQDKIVLYQVQEQILCLLEFPSVDDAIAIARDPSFGSTVGGLQRGIESPTQP